MSTSIHKNKVKNAVTGQPIAAKEILFRVYAEGREYVIFSNGEVDGFGQDSFVYNYYPSCLYYFLVAKGIVVDDNALASPTDNAKPSLTGAGHSLPE